MDPKAQKQALEKARALEKAGQADAAVKLFREAGALEDAARVLGATKGPRDAGQLLLESLRVLDVGTGGGLPGTQVFGVKGAAHLARARANAKIGMDQDLLRWRVTGASPERPCIANPVFVPPARSSIAPRNQTCVGIQREQEPP